MPPGSSAIAKAGRENFSFSRDATSPTTPVHLYNGTLSDSIQLANGISDEMYEWLPQQTMSLLRLRWFAALCDLLLRPDAQPRAQSAIYTGSGPFFGMATNYQVVSEIATRAVVRFNSVLTNIITTDYLGTSLSGQVTNYWFSVPVVTTTAPSSEFSLLPPD